MGSLRIDLNSDVGEGFGAYKLGLDHEVIPSITSSNIACGWHAGDPLIMRRTLSLSKEHGVAAGAHPGFPDLLGFGRRNLDATLEEIEDYVAYQVGALAGMAACQGIRLQHVKPHGALYNMAAKDPRIWDRSRRFFPVLTASSSSWSWPGPTGRNWRGSDVATASGSPSSSLRTGPTIRTEELRLQKGTGRRHPQSSGSLRTGVEDGEGRQGGEQRRGGNVADGRHDLRPGTTRWLSR